jgi:hypothetical protein
MSHGKTGISSAAGETKKTSDPSPPRVLPVRADEVYTLAEFQQRTRMSRAALRAARRRGLRVTQCGKRCYVAGSDWIAFLAALT